MRTRWSVVALVGILVVGLAFLFLDFHAAQSNTDAKKNVITTGIGEGLPQAMQSREKISVALIGEEPLRSALETTLAAELKKAGLGEIETVSAPQPAYPNPVLLVKVSKSELFWTPFFATSQLSIQASYSSSGNAALLGETPVPVDNKNGPALAIYGDYKVTDRSWGLISRPGYHRMLADYLAPQIVAPLQDLYQAD